MSRTFRRKNVRKDYDWVLRDHSLEYLSGAWYSIGIRYEKGSKEEKLALGHYHSDAGTHPCREPGPSWYRRIIRQVPLRRDSKEQLRKFMLNEDYEVMITENPPLEYWT